MAASTSIIQGENRRLTRNLKQASGAALSVASLALAKVQLIQAGEIKYTFTLGTHDELSEGDDGTSLILELTSTVTLALAKSNLTERYTLQVTNADFAAEPGKSIDIIDVKDVVIR